MSEEKKEARTEVEPSEDDQGFIDLDEEKEQALDWDDEDILGDYPLPRWG